MGIINENSLTVTGTNACWTTWRPSACLRSPLGAQSGNGKTILIMNDTHSNKYWLTCTQAWQDKTRSKSCEHAHLPTPDPRAALMLPFMTMRMVEHDKPAGAFA